MKKQKNIKNGSNNKKEKHKKNNILFIIMSSKQDIISSIYYDRSGYGSRATTLKDAREKDATITKEDVEELFRKNVEEKRKPRGENSFVVLY